MSNQPMKTLTIDGTTYEIVDDSGRNRITNLEALVSTPLAASTVSAMIDTTKVYVYTGSETGYTSGNWYYYNGTAWVSGGVYNAVAVSTDTTLSVSGMPADAKTVGDAIADIESGGSVLTPTAISLLETILRNALYNSNQSGNITSLIAELGGGGDDPTPSTEDVTFEDGALTIISTGANATLTDGLLTLG